MNSSPDCTALGLRAKVPGPAAACAVRGENGCHCVLRTQKDVSQHNWLGCGCIPRFAHLAAALQCVSNARCVDGIHMLPVRNVNVKRRVAMRSTAQTVRCQQRDPMVAHKFVVFVVRSGLGRSEMMLVLLAMSMMRTLMTRVNVVARWA
eukprot:symbB.v1.2.015645.t1/scaffold1142.1/size245703/14